MGRICLGKDWKQRLSSEAMAVAQASGGGGADREDGKDEAGLRGITTKEERYAGTSGMWQNDVEIFLGLCLSTELACRDSAVQSRIRILTHRDPRGKPFKDTYNLGHSEYVTKDMALCDTSQAAVLDTSVSWGMWTH